MLNWHGFSNAPNSPGSMRVLVKIILPAQIYSVLDLHMRLPYATLCNKLSLDAMIHE